MELVKKNHLSINVAGLNQTKMRAYKAFKGIKIITVGLLYAYGKYLMENPHSIYNDQF